MPRIRRKSVATTLSIDHDANHLLRSVLAPGEKRFGRVISELIRGEVNRRMERHKLLRELGIVYVERSAAE